MTTFILASDRINGHEKSILSEVEKGLKDKGHTVINNGVGPNKMQAKCRRTTADVGVQIVGGLDGWTFSDLAHGINKKYYKVQKACFPLCSWIYKNRPSSDFHHKQNVPNWKMVKAHDAGATLQKMYVGKTISEFMKEHPNVRIFGADTPQEIVNLLLNEDTKKGKKDKTKTTYMEMIKDLLKPWDGEVEIYARGKRLYIHKVPLPDENKIPQAEYDKKGMYHYKPSNDVFYASESINIIDKSITVHDYNPRTVNDLTVTYFDSKKKKKVKLNLKDNYLVKRFGAVKKTEKAVSLRADNSLKDVIKENKKTQTTKKKGKKKKASKKTKKSKKKPKKKTKKKEKTKTNKSSKNKNQDKSGIKEVAITNSKEAKDFARSTWYKYMRDNGHHIDVEVIGNYNFKVGTWCHFYAPSFGENISMYVAQCDHSLSPDSEWTTKLHLYDYAPSFSKVEDKDTAQQGDGKGDGGGVGSSVGSSSGGSSGSGGSGSGKKSKGGGSGKSKSKGSPSKTPKRGSAEYSALQRRNAQKKRYSALQRRNAQKKRYAAQQRRNARKRSNEYTCGIKWHNVRKIRKWLHI